MTSAPTTHVGVLVQATETRDPEPMWGKAPRGSHRGRHVYSEDCDDRECYWWPRPEHERESSETSDG